MNNAPETLVIRADASPQIGTGHVMRCLAMAETWLHLGGKIVFVSANLTPTIQRRMASLGVDIIEIKVEPGSNADALEVADFAAKASATWVMVDGYHFDSNYQNRLRNSGLRVLFVDDYGHAGSYSAEFILNQNLDASPDLYRNKAPHTRLLLGNDYVLLRREFLKWKNWQRIIPDRAEKILVTLGGSDPGNVTLKVIQALQQLLGNNFEAVVLGGASNPHFNELETAARESRIPIRLIQNATNIPELMAEADLAIAAGGSTVWELAFMGLPSLLIVLAKNQASIVNKLEELDLSVNLGWHSEVSAKEIAEELIALSRSYSRRESFSKRARVLVDGDGASRVCRMLTQN